MKFKKGEHVRLTDAAFTKLHRFHNFPKEQRHGVITEVFEQGGYRVRHRNSYGKCWNWAENELESTARKNLILIRKPREAL